MPTVQAPPSRMKSTRSPKLSRTCSAVVGESWVKRLALGAATGTCAASISASATGCDGMRSPTVGRPAVTRSGTAGCFRNTSVSGPGQKRWASSSARCGHSATTCRAISRAADVHDDGTALRTALGLEDASDGGGIQRVRAQPIDGLGGKRDQFAGAQHLGGALNFVAGWQANFAHGVRPREGSAEVAVSRSTRRPCRRLLPEGNSYCRPRRSGGRRRSSPADAAIVQTARLPQTSLRWTPVEAAVW